MLKIVIKNQFSGTVTSKFLSKNGHNLKEVVSTGVFTNRFKKESIWHSSIIKI